MNQFEELALWTMSRGIQITHHETFMVHPGISQLIQGKILEDVNKIKPTLDISNLYNIAEFANQFATDDGLLATPNLDFPLTPAYERLTFQIALTTIWISQYTRIKENSNCKQSAGKKQREFQTCLLVYFFNQIIGTPPYQLRKKIESITIKEYGLYNWYFNTSHEHDWEKLRIMFDIMHMCALEYWDPKAAIKEK